MKNRLLIIYILLLSSVPCFATQENSLSTSFQTSGPWNENIHIPADIAITYGDNPEMMKTWSDRGYTVCTMIGASWLGKNEPVVKEHPEIVQRLKGGIPFEMIPGRAWVVPVGPWIDHIKGKADRVVDAGTAALLPEEPEFFAVTGYSDAFKSEWRKFYGEKWAAPDSSFDARWRAGKLKSKLFTDFYSAVFSHVKSRNPEIRCIIPAHSNLNYGHWNIIAPHYQFSMIPQTDGFIGQVWTGTAKERHPAGGRFDGSIFNYAFLEYSFFDNLLSGTGKRAIFLADPVEDMAGASWNNLRNWYEQTLAASLMFPDVNQYEITPWPSRVFQTEDLYGGSPIPEEYVTELLTVWAAVRMMPAGGGFDDGPPFIGALTSDTLMWQRGAGSDRFSGFAAPMMSLVSRGVPVRVLPVERMGEKGFPPDDMRIIAAGFDAWKPLDHETVRKVAGWVASGGVLVFIGGSDDFNDMENSWWKKEGYTAPADALLDDLGLEWSRRKTVEQTKPRMDGIRLQSGKRKIVPAAGAPGGISDLGESESPLPLTLYGVPGAEVLMTHDGKPLVWRSRAGRGSLIYAGIPGEFIADEPAGDALFQELIRIASETAGAAYSPPGNMVMRRGQFVIAFSHSKQVSLTGTFLNLLRPQDGVSDSFTVPPGEKAFLMDTDKAASHCPAPGDPCILIASGRINSQDISGASIHVTVEGPSKRTGFILLRIPGLVEKGVDINTGVDSQNGSITSRYYPDKNLLAVYFPLSPDGVRLHITLNH